MLDIINNIHDWIKSDFRNYPLRFALEVLAWVLSITCSIIMAFTVPNPPLLMLYPIWISGCAIYAWAAFSRKSFGMLANYLLLTSIDLIGLTRLLVVQ
jgi:hypothetical protein